MVGFTESLNISVSAAIIIQNLTNRLRNSTIDWHLSEEEILAKSGLGQKFHKRHQENEARYFEEKPR
jgi:tRNA (guanosine-2'-O-)-methyltransferase